MWTDMMFIHNNNGQNPASGEKWAAYKGVFAKGNLPWVDWWSQRKFIGNDKGYQNYRNRYGYTMRCFRESGGSGSKGYTMTAGNLEARSRLCTVLVLCDR
jgi:hypothetical protein